MPSALTLRACVQTLQNANTLGERAGTTSVFTSALDAYPNVKACQTTSVASATTTAGR